MKKIAISFLATLWLSALAISPASSAGLGAGLSGKYINVEASGTESSGTTGSETDASSVSRSVNESSLIFSYYAEITAGENNGWALGYEAIPGAADVSDKVHERTDTETSVTSTATETDNSRTFKASAEIDDYHVTYIEVPLGSVFYVRYGMSNVDVITNEVASGNGGNYPNASLDGDQYGFGLKGVKGDRIRWKIGYQKDDFDTLNLTSTGNSVAAETNKISADLDTWSAKFSLGIQF
tara:strand:- start:1284 stop:2000 length:717 start_codon:yes stop_codon:yes gene_type:complete